MSFPEHRARRLRRTAALRELVRETDVRPADLIAPLFVKEGLEEPTPISSMPGQAQHTIESLRKEAGEIRERGVLAFVLFGIPVHKDAEGSEAWNRDGVAQTAIRALKDELGDEAIVVADLCLDEYTDHGHCGLLTEDGDIVVFEAGDAFSFMAHPPGADAIDAASDGQVRSPMPGKVTALSVKAAMEAAGYSKKIDVASTRVGFVPGIHTVGFDGPSESITLTHSVRDRGTFARGALLAATWVKGKRGWFTMRDVLGLDG